MSTRDDVLRDLLRERGLTEEQVQALTTLVERVEWVNASQCPVAIDVTDGWTAVDDIERATQHMDDRLDDASRRMAPKQQPKPQLDIAAILSDFREIWGGSVSLTPDDLRLVPRGK